MVSFKVNKKVDNMKNDGTEVLFSEDALKIKKKELEKLEKEKEAYKKKLIEENKIKQEKELSRQVRVMQNQIKQTNDLLFSLLKISIFFLVSVIIIILIKRAIG